MRIVYKVFLLLSYSILITQLSKGQPMPEIYEYSSKELPIDNVGIIKTDSDNIVWLVAFHRVMRYDGNTYEQIRDENTERDLFVRFYENAEGEKYIADNRSRLFVVEDDSLRAMDINDTIMKLNKGTTFHEIAIDNKGKFHFFFNRQGYLIVDKEGNISHPLKEKGITIDGVASILQEGGRLPFNIESIQSEFWKNEQQYFYLIDKNYEILERFPISKATDNYPRSIVQLKNGHYLFSNRGRLIEFTDKKVIKEIPFDSGIAYMFVDSKGGLWISAESAIHYYRNGEVLEEDELILLPGALCVASAEDYQGGIWIKNIKGVKRIAFPQHEFYKKDSEPLSMNVEKIDVGEDKLYVVHNRKSHVGIIDLIKQKKDSLLFPLKRGREILSLEFIEDQQRLWISQRGRVIYTDKDKWKSLQLKELNGFNSHSKIYLKEVDHDSISMTGYYGFHYFFVRDTVITYVSPRYPSSINDVLIKGDSVIVGTGYGVYLQIRDSIIDLNQQYPELKRGVFQCVSFDNQIWISFYSGRDGILRPEGLIPIYSIDERLSQGIFYKKEEDELWYFTKNYSYLISERDQTKGIDKNNIVAYAAWPTRKMNNQTNRGNRKSLFVAGLSDGILKLDFEDLKQNKPIPPYLLIEKVRINGIDSLKRDYTYSLKHDENNIRVDFLGVNYMNHQKSHYRYRMPGNEDSWTMTDETSLQFLALPADSYTLEIQAQFSDEFWSESQLLHFVISPPFWKTWWFVLLTSVAVLFIVYRIALYRAELASREKSLIISRLTAEQKALRARMDPHFVFNTLTSIDYLIEDKKFEKASLFLKKTSALMRRTLEQTNFEYVTIKDELEFLREYVEMEQMKLEEKFEYTVKVSPKIDTTKNIPNFLIQPIVENAIQYGLKNTQGMLQLIFAIKGDFLTVKIKDDGTGYDRTMQRKSQKRRDHQSLGIQTVRERLLLHNGKNGVKEPVIIRDLGKQSGERKGTEVILSIRMVTRSAENG